MKEALESSPTEPTPQDKKNYATKGADKSISANNSKANSITIADEKQSRIKSLNPISLTFGLNNAAFFLSSLTMNLNA